MSEMPQMSFNLPMRQFAQPLGTHMSLGATLRTFIWVIVVGLVGIISFIPAGEDKTVAVVTTILAGIVAAILISGMRVAAQWERGVLLRLGNFVGIRGPGIIYVIPFIDYIRFVDTRTLVLNIPRQKVITKDNVPAQIDGALFYTITDAERAVTKVQDYQFAISQYAQGALRDVVGGLSLDDLLVEREQIQERIGIIVEKHIRDWGMHVESIRLLDIELPEDLKRMMSRQASAEREKRATITKAEGDMLAAVNLSQAAQTMMTSPGAMQLRYLQTIDGLGPSSSNTVVLFPVEWTEAASTLGQMFSDKAMPKIISGEKE
ncbi:MAG: slipin family protein [bacterium]